MRNQEKCTLMRTHHTANCLCRIYPYIVHTWSWVQSNGLLLHDACIFCTNCFNLLSSCRAKKEWRKWFNSGGGMDNAADASIVTLNLALDALERSVFMLCLVGWHTFRKTSTHSIISFSVLAFIHKIYCFALWSPEIFLISINHFFYKNHIRLRTMKTIYIIKTYICVPSLVCF